ncbi:MAG: acyltransferase [Salinivirgaceae bacterium]|nr:acyltransferase [Salinivirgaceae bacterium]MBR4619526.1 acyltransferase [Salinivirgaceae bacterium]
MANTHTSLTYRLLRKFGFNYSEEEYGNVSLWRVIKQFFGNIRRKRLEKMMDWAILDPFLPRKLRPKLLRKIGCKVGKNVFIGDYVRIDLQHANMIYIDDYAHITSGCRLLCHQRDLKNYRVGDNAALCGYRKGEIHIGKGVMVGMESTIMPGVTIGDGAIVGAGSLVVKDIPAWTVAMGVPAKVVKEIPQREETL